RGFDLGCGGGRWARIAARRVGELHCIDPSEAALEVARRNLVDCGNCSLHLAGVSDIPLPDRSMDFGYCLGVLHHVPDPQAGLEACARKLKTGAPFLAYLYYALDNRPAWYRLLWRLTDAVRQVVSGLPFAVRCRVTDLIALLVYWPVARFAALMERLGFRVDAFPLSLYRNRSFYLMRNDALDRFGTSLELRFTRTEVQRMLEQAGFERIRFSERWPFWCAVGYKADS
ncbi:MAG TPA: class I SAM-dependent methyltransferase, partial [Burkholderiales bacterium]|nr:class I SAM-dependent methyltransferase [Burkholderiales bacterium]